MLVGIAEEYTQTPHRLKKTIRNYVEVDKGVVANLAEALVLFVTSQWLMSWGQSDHPDLNSCHSLDIPSFFCHHPEKLVAKGQFCTMSDL